MKIAWLEIADSPDLWRDLGYDVGDDGVCVVGGVEHRLLGTQDGKRGVCGWAVSGLDNQSFESGVDSIDGIPTQVVAEHTPRPDGKHPNGVTGIDHLVIRTSSTPRTADALADMGLERRGASDTTSSGESVDMTFFWVDGTLLELVGPPKPSADSKPARFMGIAYVADDLDSTASYLGELCSMPKDAIQPGRQIAALRKDAGSTLPMAFMTPHLKSK